MRSKEGGGGLRGMVRAHSSSRFDWGVYMQGHTSSRAQIQSMVPVAVLRFRIWIHIGVFTSGLMGY